MFKNWKLVWKLVVPFTILMILIFFVAFSAFSSIAKINAMVDLYQESILPTTDTTWQMGRNLVSIQRYIVMAMMEEDVSARKTYLDTASSEAVEVSQLIQKFKSMASGGDEAAAQLEKYVEQMEPARAKITELLLKGDEAANAEAYNVYQTTYKPLLDSAAKTTQAIGDALTLGAAEKSVQTDESYNQIMINTTVLMGIALIVCVLIVIALYRAFTPPMRQVVVGARKLVKGELDIDVTYNGRDEFGDMAQNMKHLGEAIRDIIRDMGLVLHELSQGDFTTSLKREELYIGGFEPLKKSIYEIISQLTMTLRQIDQATDQFLCTSEQVAQSAQLLSDGATQQASAIQQIAAAVTQISEKVKQNADNAREATAMVRNVEGEVIESNNHMQEMISAMNKISETSSEIGKVIKTIQDIAFQTNILALNAAVEAARAGEAGKGFAVVADEVRNLASKSADAAKGTTELIQGAIMAVGNGTKIADATAKSLLAVVEGTKAVTETVNDIANASDEQAAAIVEVTEGVDSISAVIQNNSSTAEESAATSEELSSQAQMLRTLVMTFKLKKIG